MKARLDAQMFLQSLRETERLPPARYFQFVERLLLDLVGHAMSSPFWAARLEPLVEADGGISLANWADVAPLGMAEAEAAGAALGAEGEEPPKTVDAGPEAGPFRRRDETARIADLCMFERIVERSGLPLNARLIDAVELPGLVAEEWIWNSTFDQAPRIPLPPRWPGELQLEMLHGRGGPDRLLRAAPASLAALLAALDRLGGAAPSFAGIVAIGEPLDEALRAALAERFAVRVAAIWHDPRLGVVAFRNPADASWQSALGTQFVEIIDDAGRPCPPGTRGSIAVTTLYSHATPAIRFLTGHSAATAVGGDGRPRLASIASG